MIYCPYWDLTRDIQSHIPLRPRELLQAKGYIWPYIPPLVLIRIQDALVKFSLLSFAQIMWQSTIKFIKFLHCIIKHRKPYKRSFLRELKLVHRQVVCVSMSTTIASIGLLNAFQCGTYRPPLPNLSTLIAQPQGYDLRQSTSTQLIPSCPADPPRRQSDQPCPVLPLLYRHCRLLQADARWR